MAGATKGFAHWAQRGDRLVYFDGTQEFSPTAQEIWASLFSAKASKKFEVRPDISLPTLRFSRFPAQVALLLEGDVQKGVTATVVLRVLNEEFRLGDLSVAQPDQTIVSGTWYPVEQNQILDLLKSLEDARVHISAPLRIGDVIKLRASVSGLQLIDRVANGADAAGDFVGEIEVPGLRADLYPYQKTGIAFLRSVVNQDVGCILGDEMGLGKTMQVIGLLLLERDLGCGTSLIVVPATLLENWRRELTTFAPDLSVSVHAGPKRVGDPTKLLTFDVVIASYETVIKDEPLISSIEWNLVILDEAQNIKNPNAARTIVTKSLTRRASIAVTGTPVENRLTDLWSISDFVLPGLLGTVTEFQAEFDDSAQDASRLAPVVAPLLLRRRVTDVAKDLPDRLDIPQRLEMPESLAELYEGVRRQATVDYPMGAALAALGRLRMFCASPSLIIETHVDEDPKLERLFEILAELFECNEKVLIFTSYLAMTDLLLTKIRHAFGVFVDFIDGRVPTTDRLKAVDEFSSHDGAAALILNPRAGGVGLNITAANHVVHYNLEWNPAVVDQASARSYRRRQTRPVTVHYLYYADSVEEVILDRLTFKRQLAANAAQGNEGDDVTAEVLLRALQITPFRKTT
jgi:SNF2 family DNA or RNA helicase